MLTVGVLAATLAGDSGIENCAVMVMSRSCARLDKTAMLRRLGYEKRQLVKSKGIKLLIGECCDITMEGTIWKYWRLIK